MTGGEVKTVQEQYDKIVRFFRVTTEPYDDLEWNGEVLEVVQDNITIERYTCQDLCEVIPDWR